MLHMLGHCRGFSKDIWVAGFVFQIFLQTRRSPESCRGETYCNFPFISCLQPTPLEEQLVTLYLVINFVDSPEATLT